MQLYDRAMAAAACDSLQRYQKVLIQQDLRLQEVSDSLLAVRTYELVLAKADAGEWKNRVDVQKDLVAVERQKKRRWFWRCVAVTVVFVGVEVVDYLNGK